MREGNVFKIIVTVVFILSIYIINGCKADTPDIVVKDTTLDNGTLQAETTDIQELMYVYVTGAVKNPAVYKVEKECRIYQVIEMAGGFLENADVRSINMADKVYDGMKIVVNFLGEETADYASDTYEESGMININTATKEELMTLPGIGESKAESIIRYRKENGSFQKIEDIMNISGIKEGAFDKIKDLITV